MEQEKKQKKQKAKLDQRGLNVARNIVSATPEHAKAYVLWATLTRIVEGMTEDDSNDDENGLDLVIRFGKKMFLLRLVCGEICKLFPAGHFVFLESCHKSSSPQEPINNLYSDLELLGEYLKLFGFKYDWELECEGEWDPDEAEALRQSQLESW